MVSVLCEDNSFPDDAILSFYIKSYSEVEWL